MTDVLIIGCGITGAALAFALSRFRLSTVVLERENDVSCGTTKANSAILHAGYDPRPGTLMARLNVRGAELAKRLCRELDVPYLGCGLFLTGSSGVGKSEVAVELLKRGHRLIADDAVEMRKISAHELVGTAPELIRNYIELRGIGIINVAKLYGMGAIKQDNRIDLVVNLVQWNTQEVYDRLGLEEQFTEILGVKIPLNTIPITPGRNLAVILEVAAMNNRQKRLGYNSAVEFTEQMNRHFEQSARNEP